MTKPYEREQEPEPAVSAPEPFIPDWRLGRTVSEFDREIARREINAILAKHFQGRRAS